MGRRVWVVPAIPSDLLWIIPATPSIGMKKSCHWEGTGIVGTHPREFLPSLLVGSCLYLLQDGKKHIIMHFVKVKSFNCYGQLVIGLHCMSYEGCLLLLVCHFKHEVIMASSCLSHYVSPTDQVVLPH